MAVKSQGTKLYVKNGSNYVEITNIGSLSPSGGDAETIDATALGDTSPSSVGGSPSPQALEVPLFWTPSDASHQLLTAIKSNSANVNWKVVTTEATNNTFYFTGQITSLPDMFSAERNGLLGKTARVGVNNFRTSE